MFFNPEMYNFVFLSSVIPGRQAPIPTAMLILRMLFGKSYGKQQREKRYFQDNAIPFIKSLSNVWLSAILNVACKKM